MQFGGSFVRHTPAWESFWQTLPETFSARGRSRSGQKRQVGLLSCCVWGEQRPPYPCPSSRGEGEGSAIGRFIGAMHERRSGRSLPEGERGRSAVLLAKSGSWRAAFRVCACIETMNPCKDPLTPTLSRRERESVPQSSCARACMESLLNKEIAHWDLEPKLVQLRNFADRLLSTLPLPALGIRRTWYRLLPFLPPAASQHNGRKFQDAQASQPCRPAVGHSPSPSGRG